MFARNNSKINLCNYFVTEDRKSMKYNIDLNSIKLLNLPNSF